MSVYVDDMQASFGRMKMCHLLADTEGELHEMAKIIGVARRWHQGDHYDICLSKRALAIANGALLITFRQAGAMHFRRKQTGQLGAPEDAVAWMRAFRARRAP